MNINKINSGLRYCVKYINMNLKTKLARAYNLVFTLRYFLWIFIQSAFIHSRKLIQKDFFEFYLRIGLLTLFKSRANFHVMKFCIKKNRNHFSDEYDIITSNQSRVILFMIFFSSKRKHSWCFDLELTKKNSP